MRSSRPRSKRRFANNGTQWISFSDLMSSLLLIFILIMFYIMYDSLDMYERNMAEIIRQQNDLSAANASLDEERAKLSESEKQLFAQQIKLEAAQRGLTEAEEILASQQEELSTAQSLLDEKEEEIAAQKEQLDALSVQLGNQQLQIDEQQRVLDDQQQQIEALVGMRARIITSLSNALKAAGIEAQVDPVNGSIALRSDVLFGLGKHDLTEDGENFIDDFLPVYLNVLFSEEYREYLAEIIIEGHTDSLGTYIENLELSQQRALAVVDYVMSKDFKGLNRTGKERLSELLTANGRSFSDLIRDENGRELPSASRRVVIKFRLTDEKMIQQLKNILEASEGD